MPNRPQIAAAALAALLLASCASQAPTAGDNGAADAEANGLENAGPSDPGPVSGSDQPEADPVPPPDAVSHPDGYLPDAPEPATENSSDSKAPPPATEDDYLRNGQAGR